MSIQETVAAAGSGYAGPDGSAQRVICAVCGLGTYKPIRVGFKEVHASCEREAWADLEAAAKRLEEWGCVVTLPNNALHVQTGREAGGL